MQSVGFKIEELGWKIMDALRRAEGKPLGTADVVQAVTAAVGENKAKAPVLAASVRSNLGYLTRRGKVAKVGNRKIAAWRLD